jgi:endonuclease YncB( thermonuclease family)
MDGNKVIYSKSRMVSFLAKYNIRILTLVLLAASIYFFAGAQRILSITSADNPDIFSSGDIVNILDIIDGDEVLIGDDKGGKTVLRLLGIKSFSPTVSDPLLSEYGKICFKYLKSIAIGQTAKITISSKQLDTEGRLLGTLFLKDPQEQFTVDLGLELVEKGYTLVYTKFDFANMKPYLEVQEQARNENAGFWSDERIKARAVSLKVLWDKEKQND